MKIIKHGKKFDDGKPFVGECTSCGCRIEAMRKEMKETNDQRDGDSYWLSCPECCNPIYFKDKRLGNSWGDSEPFCSGFMDR